MEGGRIKVQKRSNVVRGLWESWPCAGHITLFYQPCLHPTEPHYGVQRYGALVDFRTLKISAPENNPCTSTSEPELLSIRDFILRALPVHRLLSRPSGRRSFLSVLDIPLYRKDEQFGFRRRLRPENDGHEPSERRSGSDQC